MRTEAWLRFFFASNTTISVPSAAESEVKHRQSRRRLRMTMMKSAAFDSSSRLAQKSGPWSGRQVRPGADEKGDDHGKQRDAGEDREDAVQGDLLIP